MWKGELTMKTVSTRREFLADVGRGMLVATIGCRAATELGLAAPVLAEESTLSFGPLEPLVCLMQETPADRLLPLLVEQWRGCQDLRRLVAANPGNLSIVRPARVTSGRQVFPASGRPRVRGGRTTMCSPPRGRELPVPIPSRLYSRLWPPACHARRQPETHGALIPFS